MKYKLLRVKAAYRDSLARYEHNCQKPDTMTKMTKVLVLCLGLKVLSDTFALKGVAHTTTYIVYRTIERMILTVIIVPIVVPGVKGKIGFVEIIDPQ
jgi:hypothetical protein